MLSPDRIPDLTPLDAAAADYEVVRRAIGHIRSHWREQPEIEAIAEAAGVTPTELHHLFRRWAGLTPKAFLAGADARRRAAVVARLRKRARRQPTKSASRAPAGCTICSSRTKRCRRANGNPAAKA